MAASLSLSSIPTKPQFPLLPRAQPNPLPATPISDPPPASIPPPPDPPPNLPPPPLSTSSQPLPQVKWTSLFVSKPRSAGDFTPPTINLKYSGRSLIPTPDIVQASVNEWNEYITGFFLDAPLSYTAVVTYLKKHWNPIGPIKVKSNGHIFFFLLSNAEDRRRILEADPIVIRNKVFILKKWDVNMGNSGKEVKNVPVWIKMSNLPMVAWSKIGICWLAFHIGKFLCMDRATESLEWLGYAKVLVEITPESELPNNISVILPDGTEHFVFVHYIWKPDICQTCRKFGHSNDNCPSSIEVTSVKSNCNGGKEQGNRKDLVVNAQTNGVAEGRIVTFNNHSRVFPSRNNVKIRVQPAANLGKWKRVESVNAKKVKGDSLNNHNVVQTGNRFDTLVDLTKGNSQELEDGEIREASHECAKASNNIGTVLDNEIAGINMCVADVNKSKSLDKGKQIMDNITVSSGNMQGISREEIEFMNDMNSGAYDVNVPLTTPAVQTSTECNFRPGFLLPTSKQVKDNVLLNPMQELINEVRNFDKQLSLDGSSVPSSSIEVSDNGLVRSHELAEGSLISDTLTLTNDAQHEDAKHDSFLKHNFNLSVEAKQKKKIPPDKVQMKMVRRDKTVPETIECLREEIESGKLDSEVCEIKRQVMETMIKNYNADKRKLVSPYANIPPPPGYKAPPPSLYVDLNAAMSTSSSVCKASQSPITRSKMRAMKIGMFDNG